MTIQKNLFVPATPARVFEVFTSATAFSRMSGGAPAQIDAADGGAFSVFGGAIEGRTIEAVPGARVVQAWRAASWPAGRYSLVRFEMRAEREGTQLSLEHVGYPADQHDHLSSGWDANYVEPLKKAFT